MLVMQYVRRTWDVGSMDNGGGSVCVALPISSVAIDGSEADVEGLIKIFEPLMCMRLREGRVL